MDLSSGLDTSRLDLPRLDMEDARRVIEAALAEDVGSGDITSSTVIPENVRFHGVMRARHAMVIAGLPVAREVFRMVVPDAALSSIDRRRRGGSGRCHSGGDRRTGAGAVDGRAHRTEPLADPIRNRHSNPSIRRTNSRDRLHFARHAKDHSRYAQALQVRNSLRRRPEPPHGSF